MNRPIITPEPIREFNANDVRNIAGLDLDNHKVLSALCRAMNVHVTTEHYSLGLDCWTVTPQIGGTFSGTYVEIKAYVRGHAAAWSHGIQRTERFASKLALLLKSEIP